MQATIRHITRLPSFYEKSSNDERTEWFLSHAYVRTEAFVAAFVRTVYLKPEAIWEHELLTAPLFDPWLFFQSHDVTLPSSLVHYIYHNYPTDSHRLAETAMQDLSAGRIERAEQLFAVGAIPSLAESKFIHAVTIAEVRDNPLVSTRYPSERLLAWRPKEVTRQVCSCGFDAGAAAARMVTESRFAVAALDGDTNDDAPSPALVQELLLQHIVDPKLGHDFELLSPDPPAVTFEDWLQSKLDRARDKVASGPCKVIQYWMLPFNGTVGKYPYPLSDAEKALKRRRIRCQHEHRLTREFFVGYVQDLRRRLM